MKRNTELVRQLVLLVTKHELAKLKAQAAAQGINVSAYVRRKLGIAKKTVGPPRAGEAPPAMRLDRLKPHTRACYDRLAVLRQSRMESKMKMNTFTRIKTAVDSLSASTDLTVLIPGTKITAGRLCSPYVSHQTIEFEEADYFQARAIFVNRKYAVRLAADSWAEDAVLTSERPDGDAGFALRWEGATIPQRFVSPLLGRLHELTMGETFSGNPVRVEVACRIVAGWNDEKKPIWKVADPLPISEADAIAMSNGTGWDNPPLPVDIVGAA